MFLCLIGPVYLKLTIIIKKESSNIDKINELIKDLKDKLLSFELNLTLGIEGSTYFFLKINLAKMNAFKESCDYQLLLTIRDLERISLLHISGRYSEKMDKVLNDLFGLKLLKSEPGFSNKNSILGIEFLDKYVKDSFFYLQGQDVLKLFKVGHHIDEVKEKLIMKKNLTYPYLLVNITEGVSVYRVDSPEKYERVGGNTIGVSTFWGLVKLTCGYNDPEEAVRDSIIGSNEKIDLSVGDIYGGDYSVFGLDSSLLASSFAKYKYSDKNEISKRDVLRSLLTILCVNISQVSSCIAEIEKVENIVIIGNALNNLEFMQMTQMAANFFSKEKVSIFFSDYTNYALNLGKSTQLK